MPPFFLPSLEWVAMQFRWVWSICRYTFIGTCQGPLDRGFRSQPTDFSRCCFAFAPRSVRDLAYSESSDPLRPCWTLPGPPPSPPSLLSPRLSPGRDVAPDAVEGGTHPTSVFARSREDHGARHAPAPQRSPLGPLHPAHPHPTPVISCASFCLSKQSSLCAGILLQGLHQL